MLITFLSLSEEKDWYPWVIFFKPKFPNKFSSGKYSPKGTNLFLLYFDKTFASLSKTTSELNIFEFS